MKLLFVFTGGTIGSTQIDGVISADPDKSYKLIEAYEKEHGINFEYDVAEPYTELSENNTGWHIRALVNCIKQNVSDVYDGVIITHGTDTLQYSAAAIGYCFGGNSIPICIVSANAPIESSASNALDNLHGAIRFIKNKSGKGAFVIYRNSGSDTVVAHRATRLLASNAYSDEVLSARGKIYGYFKDNFDFVKNPAYHEMEDETEALDAYAIEPFSKEIAVVNSYVGMKYPIIDGGIKYVLLNTYHSGTVNTKSSEARDFFESARKKDVKIYATGIEEGARYSSAESFDELGIVPLPPISPPAAYMKLWLAASLDKNAEEIFNASLCGDIVF